MVNPASVGEYDEWWWRMIEHVRRQLTSKRRRQAPDVRPQVRPLATGFWMLAAAGVAVAAIWMTTAWLLDVANDAKAGTEQAQLRVDAVRTGLAAGAGAGAAVGLMLAFRRQRHQEIATALSDHDAAERRITDLYIKAADQLGSDKAAVRLAGLYALERLANNNPSQRQTIVNLICACLRMPYKPTPDSVSEDPDKAATAYRRSEYERQQRYHALRRNRSAFIILEPASAVSDPHEERQVRLTAQRVLSAHLRPALDDVGSGRPAPGASLEYTFKFWPGIALDLSGATLIDFSLAECSIAGADFAGATFIGDADFYDTTFIGNTNFEHAVFSGDAAFFDAVFSGEVDFNRAFFSAGVYGQRALFQGSCSFRSATFSAEVIFEEASFGRYSADGAAFNADTDLSSTAFVILPRFEGATFNGQINLSGATVNDITGDRDFPPGWTLEPTDESVGQLVQMAPAQPMSSRRRLAKGDRVRLLRDLPAAKPTE
jgi:uncharacterized protein YjbI with pentapeptide repeats